MKAHVEFEKIHPFVDFNGRTGRLLLLWHTVNLKMPIDVIRAKTKHKKYYPLFK